MPKLTETQLLILSGAAQRDDRAVAAPPTLKPAARGAAGQLLKHGYLTEVGATADMPVWRRDEALGPFALVITQSGLEAIGVVPDETAPQQPGPADLEPAETASKSPPVPRAKRRGAAPIRQRGDVQDATNAPRDGSKLSTVIALLQRAGGVSTSELTTATGWLPHTARAALTGLRKRGYAVETERNEGTTRYRIVSPAPQKASRSGSKAADGA